VGGQLVEPQGSISLGCSSGSVRPWSRGSVSMPNAFMAAAEFRTPLSCGSS
jgi:hypothetical protein